MAVAVLDHQDRVIHYNTNGQDKTKQCDRVDRHTQGQQYGKRGSQRYWNGNGRHQGCAPVAEEHISNRNHQCDGLEQGYNNLAHSGRDIPRGVITGNVFQAIREILGQFCHSLIHGCSGRQGIGICQQVQRHVYRRLTVNFPEKIVIRLTQLYPGHISQVYGGAVVARAQHNTLEFVDILQPALGLQRVFSL